jgi:hypothetical protein
VLDVGTRKDKMKDWEESERRYQASRPLPNGRVPVRIVGTDTVFPSITACARALKVSSDTVSKLLDGQIPESDIQLERAD